MSGQPSQFGFEYSSVFQDESVVQAYRYRPQYPAATFELLVELLPAGCRPRAVLDAGCGTGFVARPLARLVDRVDAVDFSAAASLHWFEWDTAFPRFARLLAADGLFVAVGMEHERPDWMREELGPVLARYSMNKAFAPYSAAGILAELEEQGLFRLMGSARTDMIEWRQPISEWVESIHARNGFSRDRMDPREAAEADALFAEMAARHAEGGDGMITHRYAGRLLWGRPLQPNG